MQLLLLLLARRAQYATIIVVIIVYTILVDPPSTAALQPLSSRINILQVGTQQISVFMFSPNSLCASACS